MMYINHNSFNLNDLLVQSAAATSTIYNPAQLLQPPGSTATGTATQQLTASPASYQQQLQSYNQQLHQHNKALYHTYPAQVNPYDPNRTVQVNGAQSVAQQNRNGRSTSASSLSSVSSTSSTSSIYSNANATQGSTDQQQQQAQTLLTNPSQPSQTQFNPKLTTSNFYNPYNFAYYNPYTAQQTSASTNPISTPTVTSAVGVSMPKLQSSLPKQGNNSTSASQSKQEANNILTTVDPNYQLNVLPSVAATKANNNNNSLTNPMQFSTSPTNVADTSSLLLYTNSSKNLQAPSASIYNTSTHYHKPTGAQQATTSQLTFLPTSHTADLFTSNTGLHSTHLAGLHNPAYAAQPLQLHSFASSKTQFSVGVKRKRRFKKPPELRNVLPKNSLMLLHEYRPNVEYRFVCQSGPIHRPMFTMCVDINEHKFEGTGKTKKDARMQAAEKALEFLIQHPEYIQKAVPADKSGNANSIAGEESKKNPENEEDEEQGDEAAPIMNEEDENSEETEESSGKRLKKMESNEDSNVEINSNIESNSNIEGIWNAESASPVKKEENFD